MASIRERHGRYHVSIRKKNKNLHASFGDRETAELWGKYKEDLIEEITAFQPSIKEMILLKDALEMKINQLEEKEAATSSINDYKNLSLLLKNYENESIDLFSYEFCISLYERWKKTPIFSKGGDLKSNKREKKLPSYHTVLRRMVLLGSVFSFLIEKGVNVENNAQKVVSWARKNDKVKEKK